MRDFEIFIDSGCDIEPSVLEQWKVRCIDITFTFAGDERTYVNADIPNPEFYDRMRNGETAHTAAISPGEFMEIFEGPLSEGKDVLYTAFSSGLSTTYNNARMAAEELKERFPEGVVRIVDTLAASAGQGLIALLASRKRDEGLDIEATAQYIESLVQHQCIWFSVDDLEYLKRGGRVSPTAALVGSLLNIKPLLQMDAEGHLIKAGTIRGRKKSIDAIVDKYGELHYEDKDMPVFLCHSDCRADVEYLAAQLKEKYGVEVDYIAEIGPVIGSHSGPGTIAVFFIGEAR